MKKTHTYMLKFGLVCVASMSMAACFGGDDDAPPPPVVVTPPPPPPPPPPPVTVTGDGTAASYGSGFAAAFAQGRFTDPATVRDGDTIAVSKTTDSPDVPNP